MPIGPNGEKRPANPIEAGIMVARSAVGEIENEYAEQPTPMPNHAKGGKARAEGLLPGQRPEIAAKAAKSRWDTEAA